MRENLRGAAAAGLAYGGPEALAALQARALRTRRAACLSMRAVVTRHARASQEEVREMMSELGRTEDYRQMHAQADLTPEERWHELLAHRDSLLERARPPAAQDALADAAAVIS